MDRRQFFEGFSAGYAGLTLALCNPLRASEALAGHDAGDIPFETLAADMLADWCDGMIARQIDEPGDPGRHGALACPACSHLHGRCADAIYPFLHMAHVVGKTRFLPAAIKLFDWAERNVSQPDGSWTNDMDPTSWKGTTIFGAIALAEALRYHGEVLDNVHREQWRRRLDRAAAGYLYRDFNRIDFTNLNYGLTAVYGFNLFGRILEDHKYTDRSHDLAKRVQEFFTEPNKLIYGEGKPNDNRSDRGLLPVDLGYNVEESLNGLVLYALEEQDAELLDLLEQSMLGHLDFMLPDGAWDNSWGTRQAKWSYWGSRTADGCQPAFSLMADRNPAFGAAAYKNAELLRRCTADGLLHGGPHYVSHGVKPCIHHTFAHAKALALVLDKRHELPKVDKSAPLPRETAQGVKPYPEIAVWLAARGPWRGTISACDSLYRTKSAKHIQQATGGSLAVLYHYKVGTLLAASMARYILVEERNQQPQPGRDYALTPRIESFDNGVWYTNLYDLAANVQYADDGQRIIFDVTTSLQDEDRNKLNANAAIYEIRYVFEASKVTITAKRAGRATSTRPSALVLPLVSPSGEAVRRTSDRRIEIEKPGGTVVVAADVPLSIKESQRGRVFNMVPGVEAVPVIARFPAREGPSVRCEISVI
ncbi:MAG: hypothetical protein CMJ58_18730 [Planctomycetaceae bacterium]|nr:hypothetical protein [Planctomycetaceae bacterium]